MLGLNATQLNLSEMDTVLLWLSHATGFSGSA